MALVIELTARDLKEQFKKFDRDQFSLDGCQALIDLFDEFETNTDLDIIALCCEFTEYSDFEELQQDYNDIEDLEELGDHTLYYELSNGGLLIKNF